MIGEYFTSLTRIGVPIFFMITGFFYSYPTAKRQIKKILVLFISSNLLYLLWKIALTAVKGEISRFLSKIFTVKNMVKFLLLNESYLQSHLWYLGAILYVLILVTMIFRLEQKHRWKLKKALYILVSFLLLGDLVLGKYSLLLLHQEFPYIIVRNWLFVGLPYFTIGMWLKEHLEYVETKARKNKLFAIISVTTITTLIERYMLVTNNLNPTRDHYLSTTFLAISVFLFFLFYISPKKSMLSRIGKQDSTWIYILHPILITILDTAMKHIGIGEVYNDLRPTIVFSVTTVVVEVVMIAQKKIRA